MATPIKETPQLSGKSAHNLLNNFIQEPKKITPKELKERKESFSKLEKIKTF
jgi:hypothetical protein